MNLGLEGKVALVTAASRGLGAATALAFAREGARVAICARNRQPLMATGHRIAEEAGVEVLAVPADVSKANAAQELVATVVDRFRRLDILVVNAGGPPTGTFLDLNERDWEQAVQLTLMSAVRLCYAVVPVMRQGGGVYWLTPEEISRFSVPQAGEIGTGGRNAFRGPRFFNADISLVKKFRITERHAVSFRAEAYNLFNNTNFAAPNATLGASFGKLSATVGNARVLQMALRFEF